MNLNPQSLSNFSVTEAVSNDRLEASSEGWNRVVRVSDPDSHGGDEVREYLVILGVWSYEVRASESMQSLINELRMEGLQYIHITRLYNGEVAQEVYEHFADKTNLC